MSTATTPAPDDQLAADYEALRHGAGGHRLARDVVVVDGPDAFSYLQGQLSQELAGLAVGAATPALLLEPDGKLCALVRVTRTAEERYALDTDGGWGEAVAARLQRFRLRTKVAIDRADWPCVALRGPAVPPAAGFELPSGPDGPWALAVDWNGTSGVDLLGAGADGLAPAAVRWCGTEAWEALRIEAGIPAMESELDAKTIAAEAGLVERTVSFTKGCYTGQELVARLDARGSRVARRLCGVTFGPEADPATLRGATLWAPGGDKPVGRCTSAAWCPGVGGPAGLAYLHRSVDVGAELAWSPAGTDGPDPEAPRGTARAHEVPIVG